MSTEIRSFPERVLPSPSAVLELLKPVTWFPPMWAFACGIVSSGLAVSDRWPMVVLGVLLAGPLICATSQAANDWFDRHVDAINEPNRPIPSGRVPGQWGLYIAISWTILSLAVAWILGPVITMAAMLGLLLAWAYSAPPFRLKQNGWYGNAAVGFAYEGLPWFTGAAVMAGGMPGGPVILFAALYSIGAHGIMVLNDFKAVDGDRIMGIRSLPVQLGEERAARFACIIMALPQAIVIGWLIYYARPWHAAIIAVMLMAQAVLMARLLTDPKKLAPWYNATGITLYVLGMLVSAFALQGM
jgi:chlorophyll/bacteriochlorophyll a synthase